MDDDVWADIHENMRVAQQNLKDANENLRIAARNLKWAFALISLGLILQLVALGIRLLA